MGSISGGSGSGITQAVGSVGSGGDGSGNIGGNSDGNSKGIVSNGGVNSGSTSTLQGIVGRLDQIKISVSPAVSAVLGTFPYKYLTGLHTNMSRAR